MKLIATLTDKNFTDSETRSASEPRITVRTILLNEAGKIALMYTSKYNLYSFPGGGVDEGETLEEALRREVLEETGCYCEIVAELGYIYENRGSMDYTQESYYYITKKLGEAISPILTEDEVNNGTSYNWYTIEEVDRLLMISAHETMQQKFLQARDIAVLKEFFQCY